MTFEEWWKENEDRLYVLGNKAITKQAWQAAQKAERKRILQIVAEVDKQEFVDDDWYSCCDTIVERIGK